MAAISALQSAEVIMMNMAAENSGWRAFFRRWPISHEPLRRDALNALPRIRAALQKLETARWDRCGEIGGPDADRS